MLLLIAYLVSTIVQIAKGKKECSLEDIVSSTPLYLNKGLPLS